MRKITIILFFSMLFPLVSHAQFTGELVLEPDNCEAERKCYTKYPLHYKDPDGYGWEAKAGLLTDGATIPFWAKPFIGGYYDKSYLKAAVIHDHYCDRHVKPWWKTHRVFYDMLLSLQVDEKKAKLMYYGVFIGGPKWLDVIAGEACELGDACINTYNNLSDSEKIRYESERYEKIPDFMTMLNTMENILDEDNLSIDEIEAIAISQFPENDYKTIGGTVEFVPGVGITH